MRNPLSQKVVGIQPSGIRKFFDVVNEMKDAIRLGVFGRKESIHWKKGAHFIHRMPV